MNDLAPQLPTTAPQTAASQAIVAREAQEVQASVIMAKKFPRDQQAAFNRILQACARPSLAEEAEYAYPRGGETITGPTIRLLEVCAQNWGNCHAGIKILSSDGESTEVEAFCWDYETNFRDSITFRVPHAREVKKNGVTTLVPLTSPRDIYEMIANQGARRKRKCLENVIPGDILEAARQECNKTLGSMAEKKDKVQAMVKAFQDDHKVTREDIERRIGKRIEALTSPEFMQLKKIYASLRDKMSEVTDWFPQVLDPEKIKKTQEAGGAASEAMPTQDDKRRADAERKASMEDLERACQDASHLGGDPNRIVGCKIRDVQNEFPVETVNIWTDKLRAWVEANSK